MSAAPALILTYHRVADGPDPLLQCVHPTRFADQIAHLVDHVAVVPLMALDVPSATRRVAITFDDGYLDNATVAAPILRRAGVPATFFVPSRVVDDRREHWWDRLEHWVMEHDDDALDVVVDHQRVRIDIRSAAGRQRALKALNRRLRTLPLSQIENFLGPGDPHCDRHALVDADAIAALAKDFDIGSHAATHTMLSALHGSDLESEIAGSRRTLERVLDRPVTSIAYPYGTPESYRRDAVKLARAAGYARACANVAGAVRRRTPRLELPRCMVYDWSSDEFAHQLGEWFTTL